MRMGPPYPPGGDGGGMTFSFLFLSSFSQGLLHEPPQPLGFVLDCGCRAGHPHVLPQAQAEKASGVEHLALDAVDPGHPRERAVPEAAVEPAPAASDPAD